MKQKPPGRFTQLAQRRREGLGEKWSADMSWYKKRWARVGCVRYLDGYGEFVGPWNGGKYYLFPAVSDDNETGWALIARRDDEDGFTDEFVAATWWEPCFEPTVVLEEETPPAIISRAAEMITW